jgi:hypothetical protein
MHLMGYVMLKPAVLAPNRLSLRITLTKKTNSDHQII